MELGWKNVYNFEQYFSPMDTILMYESTWDISRHVRVRATQLTDKLFFSNWSGKLNTSLNFGKNWDE